MIQIVQTPKKVSLGHVTISSKSDALRNCPLKSSWRQLSTLRTELGTNEGVSPDTMAFMTEEW
jgi:hypothetical protein